MASPFVHLHLHTEYSLLDGACRLDELPGRVAELGMDAVAVTDHGVMYGAVEFYKACREAGVRPLIGCEVYVAPRSRHQKEPGVDGDNHHLILLAEDGEGYRNLVRLVSLASLEGFYYRPRVDRELLAAHGRGLIALTSCLGGEVPKRLLRGDREGARAALAEYADIFGRGNFFVELQDHGLPEQRRVNPELVRLARELDLALVATNDVHYLRAEDAQPHDVLVCIQTGKTVQEQNRLRYPGGQFYLKSPEEMESLFAELPEALANTVAIADRCRVELRFGDLHLPHYELPAGYDAASYLRRLCYERLARRYPALAEAGRRALAALEDARRDGGAVADGAAGAGAGGGAGGGAGFLAARVAEAAGPALEGLPRPEREAWERLERELAMIERMGYPGYFLIVSDFIEHARGRGIAVGPGRGSAAGSLVAYVLGITGIDPLRYHLFFERFLNPERVSMPDMDIDFDDRRRGEVIEYVRQRYGEERVAQIITFGRMLARAVVRDVGRALGMPYAEVDRIARLVPAQLGMTLEQALELSPDLRRLREETPAVRVLLDVARRLEGLPRHASVHAAGVVIARDPLVQMVPLQRMPDGTVITQFPMNVLEELGLLKFDFLGLRTLSVIEETARLVNEAARAAAGEVPRLSDPYAVPLDDRATYELLGRGETGGVFQLESAGMREMLRDLKPSCLEDIVAAVALYRPGPMENIPAFVRAKHEGNARYPHPLLEPILKDTYGILVYQEQIMQIASVMAGFTLGQADILRRAVGKKKKEVLDAQREAFVQGCLRQGHPERLANELYDLIVKFANYGFNRCLTGDTLVPDADSGELVPVGRLYEERRLIGVLSLGPDGRLRRGRVSAVHRNGRKPVFLLRTAEGRRIRATATHRFLTPRGWVELGLLGPGDTVAVMVPSGSGVEHPLAPALSKDVGGGARAPRCASLDRISDSGIRSYAIPEGRIMRGRVQDIPDVSIMGRRVQGIPDVGIMGGPARWIAAGSAARGCAGAGWDRVVAVEPAGEEETYDLTVEEDHNFVADGFIVHNSHAAAYGLLAYVTAYLKANHPAPFMAALLTSVSDNTDKVAEYVRECGRMGLAVLPPHVNESEAGFAVRDGAIRFGLAAVKNVGLAAVEAILAARRQDGPFTSLADFLRRLDARVVNRRAVESLIKAGALDGLGGHRGRLLAALDTPAYQQLAGARTNGRNGQDGQGARSGQATLFNLHDPVLRVGAASPSDPPLPDAEAPSLQRRLAMEKEVLGIYLSGNPLAGCEEDLRRLRSHALAALRNLPEGAPVRVGGVVAGTRLTRTKGGERMAFVCLEDGGGAVEVVLFPRVLAGAEPVLVGDGAVLVSGRVSWRDEQVTVVAEEVTLLAAAVERVRGGGALVVRLPADSGRGVLEAVREALAASPGLVPVYLHLEGTGRSILADRGLWVDGGPGVLARLQAVLGADAVRWYNALPRGAMTMIGLEKAKGGSDGGQCENW